MTWVSLSFSFFYPLNTVPLCFFTTKGTATQILCHCVLGHFTQIRPPNKILQCNPMFLINGFIPNWAISSGRLSFHKHLKFSMKMKSELQKLHLSFHVPAGYFKHNQSNCSNTWGNFSQKNQFLRFCANNRRNYGSAACIFNIKANNNKHNLKTDKPVLDKQDTVLEKGLYVQ